MEFQFEFHVGDDDWVPIDVTAGTGDSAVADAFHALAAENDAATAVGSYRYKPAEVPEEGWRFFELDHDGKIKFTDWPRLF